MRSLFFVSSLLLISYSAFAAPGLSLKQAMKKKHIVTNSCHAVRSSAPHPKFLAPLGSIHIESVFDVNNPPAFPDSDAESDVSLEKNFTIESTAIDSQLQPIAPGDWIDLDPNVLWPDPTWGWSFQVCNVYWNANANLQQVGILFSFDDGMSYEEVDLDTKAWVQNNFRKVAKVSE